MRKFCLVVLFNAQGALPGNFPPARLLSQHSRIGRSWLVGNLGLHCGLLLWRSSGGNLGFQKAESGGWETFGLFVGRPRFPQTCSGSRHSQQAREIHPSCMSTRPSERDCDSDGSWEFVEGEPLELTPSKGPPPFHLLDSESLSTVGDWKPRDRISRAFEFGRKDCLAAFGAAYQPARDSFPLASNFYVVLYDPSGDWPKVTQSLARFYNHVKVASGKKGASFASPWRPGVVSRGFASEAEARAYVCGAQCLYPKNKF